MQNIEKFNIRIVDTLENNRTLIFEDTQIESPHLIYNGQDDKFGNLLTSELRFNLLVKTNVEGTFFHLFTGTETRFKVLLEDITDSQNPVVKWSGFLFPEQFNEPYTYSNFFVEFIATDGLGLLKNKYLNPDFYQDKKSVLDVVSRCLLQTGLKFPVLFAPAIQNVGFEISYLDLLVDTSSYVSGGKEKSCYDVLVLLLESNGLRLFQYKKQWVIVGLNLINKVTIPFKEYNYNSSLELEFIQDVLIDRNIISTYFFETPSIETLPVLNEMETTWDSASGDNLLPLDSFLSTNFKEVFTKPIIRSGGGFLPNPAPENFGGYIATPANVKVSEIEVVNTLTLDYFNQVITVGDLDTNYVTLKTPFFIDANADVERYGTFNLELECLSRVIDETNNYYKIEGSFTDIINNGSGKGRIVFNNHGLETGDEIIFEDAGGVYNSLQKVVKVNNNTFDISQNYISNYSGGFKINPFKGVFYFAITRKEDLNGNDSSEEIFISNFPTDSRPNGYFDFDITLDKWNIKAVVKIDKILFLESGYYNIRLYPSVYHRFINSNFYKGVVFKKLTFLLKEETEVSVVRNRNLNYSTFNSLDVFHSSSQKNLSKKSFSFSDNVNNIVQNASFNGVNYASYYLDKWKRVGVDESVSFLKSLNDIYLGINYSYNLKITGTLIGFLLPLDLLDFRYKGVRRYTPVIIDMNLTEGLTDVTLVESKYTDIESEVTLVDVNPVKKPRIEISSKIYGPFGDSWNLTTFYKIIDFTNINATIEVFGYGRNFPLGPLVWKLLYSATLTRDQGVYNFARDFNPGNYTVQVKQGGLVSNLEEVEILY
ncbi:hypothetical protein H9I45_15165 [Polaribacter haliotis]|uniref:Uncharacterized protein n=1 Tax=Polaribacter haliotis TaxID=1888915 RepID=A0A7L8AFR6_9FLAO|nr:hypothetical protein [Polaribacter haliotis]QOD60659.1 hypothetical protein H9I45_15165 [Polaribacter haliotis]